MNIPFLFISASLIGLYFGGNFTVHSSIRISLHYGWSRFLVGATIMAMGTSVPELFSVLTASFAEEPILVINGLLGSNVFNFALIAGISLFFSSHSYPQKIYYQDIFFLGFSLIVLVLTVFMISPQKITAFEGIIFLGGGGGYLWYKLRKENRKEPTLPSKEGPVQKEPVSQHFFLLAGGVALLGVSSYFLVESIISVADRSQSAGVRQFLGVMVLAFGTSLPELVTSLTALVRKEGQMSLGNIVGSNVFNLLFILPLATFFQPLVVKISGFDLAFVGISTLLVGLFLYLRKIRRIIGSLLLLLFSGYMGYLFLLL